MAVITTAMRTQVSQLYVSLFGRAPDAEGLGFWVDSLANTSGQTIAKIAQSMYETAPARAYYPLFATPEEVVTTFYTNVLGRAPDAEGLTFWVAEYKAAATKGAFFDKLVSAVVNYTGTDAAGLVSKNLFVNKVAVAQYYGEQNGNVAGATAALAGVTDNAATVVTAKAAILSGGGTGQTFTLTTGLDTWTGTAGNDVVNAIIDGTTDAVVTTMTTLDSINGGAGVDTLTLNVLNGVGNAGTAVTAFPTISVTGIETVNLRSAVDLKGSTASWTGVTAVNLTQGAKVELTSAATTDITVGGATGDILVDGGNNIVVTNSTAGKDVTVGDTTVAAGNVSVTTTKAGASSVYVDGGVNVTLNISGTSGGADTIKVGNGAAATDLPTGVVSVTSNHTGVAATDVTLDAITVKGGSAVTVTQTADSSKVAADTTGATLTQGAVTITGSTKTTSVTSTQATGTVEVVAVAAVAGVTETASVKFGALVANDVLIIGGDGDATLEAGELALTATTAMSAAEVAAAFSNLVKGTVPVAGDTQGTAAASKGVFTGALTGWTSGAVSTDTVVFTSTTAVTAGVTDLAQNLAGTGTAPTITTTAGVTAVDAVTGVLGVVGSTVVIDDNATAASLTTVTVNGYGASSTIGATNNVTKLATLNLSNSQHVDRNADTDFDDANEAADMTVNVGGALASLALNLDNINDAVTLTGAGLTTLAITATGTNSAVALSAAAAETLTIAGTKSVNLTTGTLSAVKSVTVTGTAGLSLDGDEADTLTSVTTTGTTGSVTAHIKGGSATYTGGAGVDTVTLNTDTALTKAIDLGAGDDTLSFAALSVTGSTKTLSGGEGTDVLSMAVATADTLDASVQTFYTNFERLTLNSAAGTDDATANEVVTVNLENLGFTNYVTSNGTVLDTSAAADSDILALTNLASGGTVVLVAAAAGANTKHTISVKDATTGTADVLNFTLSSSGALNGGTVTAAKVETVNLTATDTNSSAHTDVLTLTAADATAVTVAGNAALTLTMTGSTKVTSINGSSMTAALSVTSVNTTSATTITGGSKADVLTAATGTTADVLIGGAGDDTLVNNAGLTVLTGGTGNDVFTITAASANVNSYATITDFAAGDIIDFTGASSFKSAAISLGDTAVFQDYANAAINAITADNGIAWFQFGGNTYIVKEADNSTNANVFVNVEDFIVKLTGLIDLTGASFNDTNDTIAL